MTPVPVRLPSIPSPSALLFGAPIRPESIRAFADACHYLAARRTPRVVTHVLSYALSGLSRSQPPSASPAVVTRWTLGPFADRVVVGLRYQAHRPKDGDSEAAVSLALRRLDAELIDGAAFGAADLTADPTDNVYFPRWAWLQVAPVSGPDALVAAGYGGDAVELTATCTDVRLLTVVCIELPRSEVG